MTDNGPQAELLTTNDLRMILIVGATGFLGQETTRQLLAAGHRVRVMARTPEKAASLKEAGAEVVAGDLIDPASLQRACAGAEVVIAAAHSLLGRGRYNSPKVDDSGHRSLIDALCARSIHNKV